MSIDSQSVVVANHAKLGGMQDQLTEINGLDFRSMQPDFLAASLKLSDIST